LYGSSEIDFSLLHEVIESLLRHCPGTLYIHSSPRGPSVPKSPYVLLDEVKETLSKDNLSGKNRFEGDVASSWKKTHTLLKHTCIGDSSKRSKKLEYLYGGEHSPTGMSLLVRLFCFLPSRMTLLTECAARSIHFERKSSQPINRRYVENYAKKVNLRFETALQYVSLRRANFEKTDKPRWNPDAAHPDRNPFAGVFSWLADEKVGNVTKIFTVTVDDLVPFPHTDEAIKTALQKFEIVTWDWRKLDICSETIFKTAPMVQHLYLHWSGNEAVLMSWICDDGLSKLTKVRWRPDFANHFECHLDILLASRLTELCCQLESITITTHLGVGRVFARFCAELTRTR
jgi:hypothetical protein